MLGNLYGKKDTGPKVVRKKAGALQNGHHRQKLFHLSLQMEDILFTI
jgi:hypothetical protein